jgi:transcriptional regulator with GAF, ATPase, and Fis domain
MNTNSLPNDLAIDFLHDISSRIAADDPLHQDLERIIEFASAVVKCDSCFVYLREGDDLVLRASKNPHEEVVDRLKLQVGQGITGWVAEHREPVAVSQNASQDARFKMFHELPEDAYEAFLSVPILSRGRHRPRLRAGFVSVTTTRSGGAAEQRVETPKNVVHRIPRLRCRKDMATMAERLYEVQSKKSMRVILRRDLEEQRLQQKPPGRRLGGSHLAW